MLTIKETATKAITAAVIAFATGIGTQLQDGTLDATELGISAGAALLAFAATWIIPNQPIAKVTAADPAEGLEGP